MIFMHLRGAYKAFHGLNLKDLLKNAIQISPTYYGKFLATFLIGDVRVCAGVTISTPASVRASTIQVLRQVERDERGLFIICLIYPGILKSGRKKTIQIAAVFIHSHHGRHGYTLFYRCSGQGIYFRSLGGTYQWGRAED